MEIENKREADGGEKKRQHTENMGKDNRQGDRWLDKGEKENKKMLVPLLECRGTQGTCSCIHPSQ